jgi:hypothetical protein
MPIDSTADTFKEPPVRIRVTPIVVIALAALAAPGCAAYFQGKAFEEMAAQLDREGSDVYVHDLAKLKQVKKVIIPDFRVIFPTTIHGLFKVFDGSAHEGILFVGDQGMGTLIAEQFEEELLRTRKIEVLERNQLQRILNEMNLQINGFIDNPGFQPGKFAGADAAILGTITSSMYYMPDDPMLQGFESVSFRLRVIDLRTGAILMLYRDRRLVHGQNVDEDALLREFAKRFVEALKKQGVIN